MPVYNKHRLIHIHIPKTAGTAIGSFFHDIGDMNWGPASWFGQAYENNRWYEYQHLSMTELAQLARYDYSGYTSFTVVRDPYTRLLSDFAWRQNMQSRFPDAPIRFFYSLAEFVEAIPENLDTQWDELVEGVGQDEANFLIHVRPQWQFVFDNDGKRLVDRILSYEALDQELANFLAPFGLYAETIWSPRIRTLDGSLNRAHIDKINTLFARDFERFSYDQI